MKRIIPLLLINIVLNITVFGQKKNLEISGIGLSTNFILEDGLEYPVLGKINVNSVIFKKVNLRLSFGKYGKSELVGEDTGFENLLSISGHIAAISGYANFLELGPFSFQFGGGIVGGNSKNVFSKYTMDASTPSSTIIFHDLDYTNEYGVGFEVYGGIEYMVAPHFSFDVHLSTYSMYGIELYGKFYYTGITLNYLIHNEKKDEN